nr:immunoglobulin light chain junction region [Mus musculus]
CKQAYDVPTF